MSSSTLPPRIAILGAGQLGSRHLQAFSLAHVPMDIWVVDPNLASLDIARQRWESVAGACQAPQKVTFIRHSDELPLDLAVAIVATNADVRRVTTEAMLARSKVGSIIFEKVLFQTEEDHFVVESLLKNHGVQGWVNCPRRIWSSYRALKERIGSGRIYSVEATGSLWGLGCNSIHMVDLLSWLGGTPSICIDQLVLDPEMIPSKRAGFMEFSGTLAGHADNGSVFRLSSWGTPGIPFVLTITAENLVAVIREDDGRAWVATSDRDWSWSEEDVRQEYQSQLTHLVVEQLLNGLAPGLTPFEESVQLQIPLIRAFLSHLSKITNQPNAMLCPIT